MLFEADKLIFESDQIGKTYSVSRKCHRHVKEKHILIMQQNKGNSNIDWGILT